MMVKCVYEGFRIKIGFKKNTTHKIILISVKIKTKTEPLIF